VVAAGAPRVLVLGLDLGDGRLLREWAARGDLPHLAGLLDEGSAGELSTTAELLHVSAWPTLYTGADPGVHGVYYTFQASPGLQGYRRFGADQYGVPTVWSLLGRGGVRSTVLDAPYTHPEAAPGVAQILDWGTWARYWKPDSVPPSMLRRLRRKVGDYPLGLEAHDQGLAALDPDLLQPRLLESVGAKTDAILWLMDAEPWDLFFTVYGETHLGGHYLWRPAQDREKDDRDLRLLGELYRALDTGIGRILAALPEETTVFLVSGDAVAPNHSGWHLLPDVLRRLGHLAEPQEGSASDEDAAPQEEKAGRTSLDPVRMLRDLLPKDFRKSLARRLPTRLRDTLARRVDTANIDWSRTRAFTLPTDLEGCIRVNLRGREPQGVVEPGEYDALCDEITEELRELVNPATGRPAVADVVRSRDRLEGPRCDRLPDLVVLWSMEAPIESLRSPRIGVVSAPSPDARPGTHAPPGFLLVRGPGVPRGGLPEGAHVRDLAPTLLSLYGVERPDYMRGSSLLDRALTRATEER